MSTSTSADHVQQNGVRAVRLPMSSGTEIRREKRKVSDKRVANALHMMQDHLQQTTVISQWRSQETLAKQSASKAKGSAAFEAMEAATQAREWQAETRRLHEQKRQEAADAETMYSGAIKDTLEKTGALEKDVQESVATTEADFYITLLDRHEDPQKHLNELSAQLS